MCNCGPRHLRDKPIAKKGTKIQPFHIACLSITHTNTKNTKKKFGQQMQTRWCGTFSTEPSSWVPHHRHSFHGIHGNILTVGHVQQAASEEKKHVLALMTDVSSNPTQPGTQPGTLPTQPGIRYALSYKMVSYPLGPSPRPICTPYGIHIFTI